MTRHDTPALRKAARTAIRMLLIAGVVVSVPALVPLEHGPALPGLRATCISLGAVLAVMLFVPRHDSKTSTALAASAAATVIALVVVSAASPQFLWSNLPRLTATLFLLCATFATASRYTSITAAVSVFALLTLLPVWAAPLVEFAGNPGWLNSLVIACSPLTAIAVSVDFDYLRSEWFYAHSALGSLRYSYPQWVQIILVLAVLPAAAVIHERLRSIPSRSVVFQREAHS